MPVVPIPLQLEVISHYTLACKPASMVWSLAMLQVKLILSGKINSPTIEACDEI